MVTFGFNLILIKRPQFKSHETPRNKMVKKKLYSHIMVNKWVKNHQIDDILFYLFFYFLKSMRHEYVKLQWRHMLNGEKVNKSSYLPPLSYKATLNELGHKTS